MFDHEKECSGAIRTAEDRKRKVGRFHEELFDLMTEWPTIKRLIWRIEVAEKTSHEVIKEINGLRDRIEALEKTHGKS